MALKGLNEYNVFSGKNNAIQKSRFTMSYLITHMPTVVKLIARFFMNNCIRLNGFLIRLREAAYLILSDDLIVHKLQYLIMLH